MMKRFIVLLLAIGSFCGPALAQEAVITLGPKPDVALKRLVIYSSTDIAPFKPLLQAFSKMYPSTSLRYEQRATNDIYNVAAKDCARNTASADLIISSSIDQQVKLVNDGCAQAYKSNETDAIPNWAKWRDEIFGITIEPAVIVYNRTLMATAEVPQSRFDLIDLLRKREGKYAGRIATYDIESSGLGYLFAFADYQQGATFGRLVEAFGANDAVATCCSAEIIDRVANGEFLIGYNMLGSYALARAAKDPRIGIVAPRDYTLLLSRAALFPKHARNTEPAHWFLDMLLSHEGKRLLSEASLIIDADGKSRDDGAPYIDLQSVNLRPIPLNPSLLVGLDNNKKQRFLKQWKAAFKKL